MAGFPAAVDLFAGEKEKQTMESLLMAPLRRSQIVISKWVVITIINFVSGVIVFAGSLLFANAFHQSGVIIADDQLLKIGLFFTLSLLTFAALNAALLIVISVSTASYKDAQNMSTPVTFAWLAAPIYLLTAPLSSWSIWMFFVPALNVSALIYGITAGTSVIGLPEYAATIGSNLVATVIVLWIAIKMFQKDRYALGHV
ncbi:ABC transporter permease subunit [Geomicrobium sp. JCM 19039]|uniref:ABC transporter permease subunit n=1 Tax=Geomicrobium sp. JCM 19039 TaxID=1460636 RepID=UPI00045F2491|nr:ABC transporter permease subunit [Geomicrobium sp. JCM 19039]GAK14282.1 sodium export permease protein [Geomicrobium sp. JCM 19039]